ncbi:hypothetical protein [Nocardioides glacieisoli]|nr:hypothetical protein [Nocardioides glacieisoli]
MPDILGYDLDGPFVADVKPEASRTEYSDLMFELTRVKSRQVVYAA